MNELDHDRPDVKRRFWRNGLRSVSVRRVGGALAEVFDDGVEGSGLDGAVGGQRKTHGEGIQSTLRKRRRRGGWGSANGGADGGGTGSGSGSGSGCGSSTGGAVGTSTGLAQTTVTTFEEDEPSSSLSYGEGAEPRSDPWLGIRTRTRVGEPWIKGGPGRIEQSSCAATCATTEGLGGNDWSPFGSDAEPVGAKSDPIRAGDRCGESGKEGVPLRTNETHRDRPGLTEQSDRRKANPVDKRFRPYYFPPELKVSLKVQLHDDGYLSNEETLKQVDSRTPYDRYSREFLQAIDLGRLPGFEKLRSLPSCTYYEGSIVAEITDERKHAGSPKTRNVLLRPDYFSLVTDIEELAESESLSGKAKIELERRLVKAVHTTLDLGPSPDFSELNRGLIASADRMNFDRRSLARKRKRSRPPLPVADALPSWSLLLLAAANKNQTTSRCAKLSKLTFPHQNQTNRLPYGSRSVADSLPVDSVESSGPIVAAPPPLARNPLTAQATPPPQDELLSIIRLNANTRTKENSSPTSAPTNSPTSTQSETLVEVTRRRGQGCGIVIKRSSVTPQCIRFSLGSKERALLFAEQYRRVVAKEGLVTSVELPGPGESRTDPEGRGTQAIRSGGATSTVSASSRPVPATSTIASTASTHPSSLVPGSSSRSFDVGRSTS
uniref:Spt20-like SEP domain-containing protein n=1 Tax=Compsopogon caeruleus TaxID=31354 RepID=A0A6T6CLF3_9RHOD|mmetsp:Transcript_3289/g.6155  ORF Transcript_3289/g.6155 Transcript_3289/m.6155 type:complete len:663 (+) Transcript_3289:43-2031(+)